MKRKSNLLFNNERALQVVKKRKLNDSNVLGLYQNQPTIQIGRTSKMKDPTNTLIGHKGEVFATRFSRNGKFIASGGMDQKLCIWNTYEENEKIIEFTGHKNAIMDCIWQNSERILSCSADKSILSFDTVKCVRERKYYGHREKVNTLCVVDPQTSFISGSDDGTIRLFDERQKRGKKRGEELIKMDFPVLSIDIKNRNQMICGNLSNTIQLWDIRQLKEVSLELEGHQNGVTGVSLSNDQNYLLSFSMDSTLRIWNLKSFSADSNRLEHVLKGPTHSIEKNLIRCRWGRKDRFIACGSADLNVYVFDRETGNLIFKRPGHKATVNCVDFNPEEPILSSCSTDGNIILGEYRELM